MPELLSMQAPETSTLDESKATMRDVHIPATDGFTLGATLFEPVERRRATVIINSATAVPRRYYRAFATYLAERGLRVVTYDYRGIGGSRPRDLRGFEARMADWGERDFAGVLDWISDWTRPDEHVYVIGHSVGGQLVGLAKNNHSISGMVAVGAQFGDYRLWPFPSRLRYALTWSALLPITTATFGYLPKQILGQSLPRGVAEEWARWALTPGYMIGDDASRSAGFARVQAPILALSIEDDDYAPLEAVQALTHAYQNARVWHRTVRPRDHRASRIGHFGLFRARFRDSLWREIAQWVEARAELDTIRSAA